MLIDDGTWPFFMLIIISDEASNMEYYLSSSKKFKGKYYTLMSGFHRNIPNIPLPEFHG